MADPADRHGHGKWTTVRDPRGILWARDDGLTGFDTVPGTDTTAIDDRLGEGFDVLASEYGGPIVYGDLGHWTPDQ